MRVLHSFPVSSFLTKIFIFLLILGTVGENQVQSYQSSKNSDTEADYNDLLIIYGEDDEEEAKPGDWPHDLRMTFTVTDFSTFKGSFSTITGYTNNSCGLEQAAKTGSVVSWTLKEALVRSGIFAHVLSNLKGDLILYGQILGVKRNGLLSKNKTMTVAMQIVEKTTGKKIWTKTYSIPFNTFNLEKRIAGDLNYKYSLPFPELTEAFTKDLKSFLISEKNGIIAPYLERWIFDIVTGNLTFNGTNELQRSINVSVRLSDGRRFPMTIPAAHKEKGILKPGSYCFVTENEYGFYSADFYCNGSSVSTGRFLFKAPEPMEISFTIKKNENEMPVITIGDFEGKF